MIVASLLASLNAITVIFLCIIVGALCSVFRVVSPSVFNGLGKLLYVVFLPSLVCLQIARSVSIDDLITYWSIPVYNILFIAVGYIVGIVLHNPRYCRKRPIKRIVKRVLTTCIAYGNVAFIAYVLMGSLTADSMFFGEHTKKAGELATGLIAVFNVPLNLIMWTFGSWFVEPDKKKKQVLSDAVVHNDNCYNGEKTSPSTTLAAADTQPCNNDDVKASIQQLPQQLTEQQLKELQIDQHLREGYYSTSSSINSFTEVILTLPKMPEHHDIAKINDSSSKPTTKWAKVKRIAKIALPKIFTPPTVGVLIGFIVGLIGPLKSTFILQPPPIVSAFASTLDMMGKVVFPTSLMVLGSNVITNSIKAASLQQKKELTTDAAIRERLQPTTKLQRAAKRFKRLRGIFSIGPDLSAIDVALNVFARLLLVPAICMGLVIGGLYLGVFPRDATYFLVLMVEAYPPAASTNILLCQAHERPPTIGGCDDDDVNETGEREMSVLLLYQYVFSLVTLTAMTMLSLYLAFSVLELPPVATN